jgi:hypothetical protein
VQVTRGLTAVEKKLDPVVTGSSGTRWERCEWAQAVARDGQKKATGLP